MLDTRTRRCRAASAWRKRPASRLAVRLPAGIVRRTCASSLLGGLPTMRASTGLDGARIAHMPRWSSLPVLHVSLGPFLVWSTASLHPRYPCPPLLQKTQAAESLGRGRHLGSTRSVPWSLCAASCPPASAGLQHEQCILENNRAGAGGRWRWTCFRQAAASSPQALRGSVRSCLPTSRQVPDTRFPCSESPRVFDEPGGSAFKPFLALSAGTCETITHGFSIPGDRAAAHYPIARKAGKNAECLQCELASAVSLRWMCSGSTCFCSSLFSSSSSFFFFFGR
ncbi:unnamed protein product, partial [Prorocentrum cordatum]